MPAHSSQFAQTITSKLLLLSTMSVYRFIVLISVAFLANANVLLAATKSGENATGFPKVPLSTHVPVANHHNDNGGRSLRGAVSDADKLNLTGTEDRGFISSIIRKFKTHVKVSKEANKMYKDMQAWVNSGKSDYEAQSLLELAGMSDDLGFSKIRTADQLSIISNTAKFKLYERYVRSFDRASINRYYKARIPVSVSSGASEAEMTARTTLLARQRRPDKFYAKTVLGLNRLSAQAIKKHNNYRYYELYLKLTKQTA
ncbi:unnamed protein product [Phytophthora lilii]|uniref:RxLR effector protein n=1 Tax=Phytophthora lilii TaxID=2077276 RepID=A0A9W7D8D0_9STRA|nr:unnamed protein product [Phytophthora lilii]